MNSFAPLVSDLLRDTQHLSQDQATLSSWVIQQTKASTSFFELTAECPEQYSALLSSLATSSYLGSLVNANTKPTSSVASSRDKAS